jgi:hypothetical protein
LASLCYFRHIAVAFVFEVAALVLMWALRPPGENSHAHSLRLNGSGAVLGISTSRRWHLKGLLQHER